MNIWKNIHQNSLKNLSAKLLCNISAAQDSCSGGVTDIYTNADCTLYNKSLDKKLRVDTWHRTVIKGVYWEDTVGQKLSKNITNDCNAFIIIPHNADFGGKHYVKPKEYDGSSDTFTFAANDVIIRGICENEINQEFTLKQFHALDDAHTIMSADDFRYGSDEVRHMEVTAK